MSCSEEMVRELALMRQEIELLRLVYIQSYLLVEHGNRNTNVFMIYLNFLIEKMIEYKKFLKEHNIEITFS